MSETERLDLESFTPEAAVTDYLSASQNGDPGLYPGQRPAHSFVTDGSMVFSVQHTAGEAGIDFTVPTASGEANLDIFLSQYGVPGMDERIPVLAYGANMSPGSLATKFRKDVTKSGDDQAEIDNRPDLSIVPVIYGELPGHDVVWSGGPGLNGNYIAALYGGPEVANTSVQVGINFLTREQLLIMHSTEMSYQLSAAEVMVDGQQLRAYYYAGIDKVLFRGDHPVAIESVPAHNRALESDSTNGLVEAMLSDDEILGELTKQYPELADIDSAEAYYGFVKSLRNVDGSKPKTRLREFIHSALSQLGRSKQVVDGNMYTHLESWANPSTLPDYGELKQGVLHTDLYVLPSQVLSTERWQNRAARDKILGAIGTHTMRASGGLLELAKEK